MNTAMHKNDFLKLLQTNDKDKIKEWLVCHSKPPKTVSAVMFEKKGNIDGNKSNL